MVTSNPEDPKKQPNQLTRIEREVLEILERTEQEKPPVTDMMRWKAEHQARERQEQLRSLSDQIRARMTPGVILAFGIVLTLVAFFSRHSTPGLARGAAFLAVVCLIVPFLIAAKRPTIEPGAPRRWRGQDVVFQHQQSPADSLRRWWKSRH